MAKIRVNKMFEDIQKNMTESEAKRYAPVQAKKQNITAEKLKEYLPRGSSVSITEELLNMLNNAEEDVGIDQALFEEQMMSYLHMVETGVGIEKLANAIKYCNLRMLPKMSNVKAYKIVFPEKAKEIEERGQSCDSFASMYNNTKLVTQISKLLMVPVYITNAPVHMAMHKKLFDLTNGIGAREGDYVSPTVQMNAAIALMEATKMPEDNSIELKIGMTDDAKNIQAGLTEQLARMADVQVQRLKNGESISSVQKIGVSVDAIEADVDE